MREGESVGMTRRSFLMSGGVAVTLLLPELSAFAQPGGAVVELMEYPMKKVARLSELKEGQPLGFTYPLEKQPNFLVKLGAPAQGGVGPARDVVAFSSLCTHMGGSLRGRYRHDLKAVGPCPFETALRIAAAASIDIGGIEYLVGRVDGRRYFYDLNATSNFVADAPAVLAFDPFPAFVDFIATVAARSS
jgi:arsenite oxidase small subunit